MMYHTEMSVSKHETSKLLVMTNLSYHVTTPGSNSIRRLGHFIITDVSKQVVLHRQNSKFPRARGYIYVHEENIHFTSAA